MDLNNTVTSMATLTLADLEDEDGSHQIGNVHIPTLEGEEEFYAVGRLLTEKPVKFVFFRDTMAEVWRPSLGMNIKELQPRRFLFRFYHENDISRIIDGTMRTFFRVRVEMDVLKPLKKGMKLKRDNGWDVNAAKSFGPELCAGGRRMPPSGAQKWIAPEVTSERRSWAAPRRSSDCDEKGKSLIITMNDCLTIRSTEVMHGQPTLNKEGVDSGISANSLTCMGVTEKGNGLQRYYFEFLECNRRCPFPLPVRTLWYGTQRLGRKLCSTGGERDFGYS
nr:uncharacterized protein LOC109150754 [Ipomoea trifida]